MMLAARGAFLAARRKPRLPYDAEVEYLESTGTQWIDTGINAKQSLKIKAIFETRSTTSYFAYGVRAGNSTITCASGAGKITGYVRWGESAHVAVVPSGLVDITQDSSGVIVNGTSYPYPEAQTVVGQSGYTIVLFAGRNSTTTVTANMVGEFYSCKIWDNGTLVRDLIPVRFTNEQGQSEGAMYDRLGTGGMNPDGSPRTDGLYRNRGTGAFSYGADKN